jgi:hypothetical protein
MVNIANNNLIHFNDLLHRWLSGNIFNSDKLQRVNLAKSNHKNGDDPNEIITRRHF